MHVRLLAENANCPTGPILPFFWNKVPWSFSKIQNHWARDTVPSTPLQVDVAMLLGSYQWGASEVPCATSEVHPQKTALRMCPFLYLPLLWAAAERCGGWASFDYTGENKVRSVCGVKLPTHPGLLLPLNCSREEKQIASSLAHDTPGFLSYSSLGYALTDATLLHLTRVWGNVLEIHMEK